MISTDATKDQVRNIDCDPKQAVEAAAVMFGLNSGLKAYETTCAGGDKVPTTGAVDGLLQFGRRCLQDSGLTEQGKLGHGGEVVVHRPQSRRQGA